MSQINVLQQNFFEDMTEAELLFDYNKLIILKQNTVWSSKFDKLLVYYGANFTH